MIHELILILLSSDLTVGSDATAVVDCELMRAEDTLGTVETTIRKLLLRLRRHHNVTRPINKLPIEILQIVFQLAGLCGFDLRTNLSIAAVCKHWREAALYHPHMWTCFEATGPASHKALAIILERNVSLPLDLAFNCPRNSVYPTDVPQWFETFILGNTHRIRSLKVKTTESFPAANAIDEAPILEELSLFFSKPTHADSSLLHSLISPKLKSLDLTYCRRPWLPGMYANLTHLRLEAPPWTLPQPDEDMTIIFRESPTLESLDMRFSHPDAAHFYEYNAEVFAKAQCLQERFPMHRLRRVELHMPVEMLTQVLVAIELPQDMQTMCLVAFFGPETIPVRLLFSSRCIPNTLLSSLRTLRLYDGGDQLHIDGSTSFGTRRGKERSSNALSITCHPQRYRVSQQLDILGGLIDAICAERTLPLLTGFLFHCADDQHNVRVGVPGQRNTAHDVADLLHHLPSITALTLRYESLAQCGRFFEDLSAHLPPSALPALSTCTITTRQRRPAAPSSPYFDAIVAFLGTLADRIKTLRFTNTLIRVLDRDAERTLNSYIQMIKELGITDTCLPATAFAVGTSSKSRKPRYLLAERMISAAGWQVEGPAPG